MHDSTIWRIDIDWKVIEPWDSTALTEYYNLTHMEDERDMPHQPLLF